MSATQNNDVDVFGRRIGSVLRILADYYETVDPQFSEEQIGERKRLLHESLAAIGPEAEQFAGMLYHNAIKFAPEAWPDIPGKKVYEWHTDGAS